MNEIWRDWRGAEAEIAPIRRTVIPQFTLRWLLGLTIVCACLFSVVGWGVRGHAWAAGVSTVFGATVLAMLVQGAVFLMIWCVSLVRRPGQRRRAESPFLAAETSAELADQPIEAVLVEEDELADEEQSETLQGDGA